MFTPLTKLAEPPPPKGVSSKEWDRILQEGPDPEEKCHVTAKKTAAPIDLIRKISAQRDFEELTAPPVSSDPIMQYKLASVDDPELFDIAFSLSDGAERALQIYESMGGTFEKRAFGAPMFGGNQLAGSPALQGAMKPGGGTAQAPQLPGPQGAIKPPQAPAQQGGGGSTPMQMTTTTKQVVAPATPAAPAAPSGQSSQTSA